jgi:dipeptidyl aminopeptidase/acylaminoacyl peptidase
MLGVLDGQEPTDDDTPVNRESSKVQCVVARAAPSDLTTGIGEHFLGLRVGGDSSSIEFKRAVEASPIAHVTADDPPILLIHGDKDDVVPFALSEAMNARLKDKNVPSQLIRVEGGAHGPSIVKSEQVQSQMVQWMDLYLKAK